MRKCLLLGLMLIMLSSFHDQKELKWMAIGDSITFLDGHPDESNNRITKGYMERVENKLPYIRYVNHGHNGWTSSRMAAAINSINLEKAAIYTIFLGTNDWWAGLPVGNMNDYNLNTGNKTMYGSFRVIIDKIRSLNKKANIILITPMQRGDFVYVKNFKNNAYGSYKDKKGHNLKEYADGIKEIATHENFKIVDLYDKSGITPKNVVKFKRLKDPLTGMYKNFPYPQYLNIPFNPETDEYPYPLEAINMTYDGLHPSDKGLSIIAKMLEKELKLIN